jgi:catechol 2,3-dioxygenase-like lactoylglutathione lyase family enzyme
MNALEFRFAFFARDFEKSVSFYRDMLGMKYMEGWDREDDKGALLSTGGTGVIEIFGEPQGKTYEGPSPVAINLALRFEDVSTVDSFYEELVAKGAENIRAPKDYAYGHHAFRIIDPDNIPIYVYCELN